MKLIALEEHYCPAEIFAAWGELPAELKDPSLTVFNDGKTERQLLDLGEERIKQMDSSGIDVQVISLTTPATQILEAEPAVRLARLSNDLAATAVRTHPDRLQAFATLPTPDARAAVYELNRCVQELGMRGAMLTGRTRNRPLDAPEFAPVLATAARLRVPLYIHPQIPVLAVRQALYTGFDEVLDTILATGGWGWHAEAGMQALRLILSGTFDRHPELQIILGHWGEIILFFLERIDAALGRGIKGKLNHSVADYVKSNFYVTPSGIFSQLYLRNAIEIMGAGRIMFSVDYPFQPGIQSRSFLADSGLSGEDQAKIAHKNWEGLSARLNFPYSISL